LRVLLRFAAAAASAGMFAIAALQPASALADDEASRPSQPARTSRAPVPGSHNSPTLINSVSSSMQSAADVVLRSTQDVTDQAMDLIGVRYKFGGQTPDMGLDCSGLVKYVFERVTGIKMPRSAREQAKVGEKIDRDELQPGDLVFFNTRRAAFSHVGIYLGDNSFIHAPRRKSRVQVANMDGTYWKKRFNGARRLLGIMPGMVSIEAAQSLLQALPAASAEERTN
jgi:cell wall-associated NlpC family hydrolase